MRRLTVEEIDSYDVVPAELAQRVRVQRVPVLTPGFDAMTLGRLVLVRRDDDRTGGSRLLAHELAHVAQYAEVGTVRFLWRYASEYFAKLARLRSPRQAYEAVSFEADARAVTARWARRRSEPPPPGA